MYSFNIIFRKVISYLYCLWSYQIPNNPVVMMCRIINTLPDRSKSSASQSSTDIWSDLGIDSEIKEAIAMNNSRNPKFKMLSKSKIFPDLLDASSIIEDFAYPEGQDVINIFEQAKITLKLTSNALYNKAKPKLKELAVGLNYLTEVNINQIILEGKYEKLPLAIEGQHGNQIVFFDDVILEKSERVEFIVTKMDGSTGVLVYVSKGNIFEFMDDMKFLHLVIIKNLEKFRKPKELPLQYLYISAEPIEKIYSIKQITFNFKNQRNRILEIEGRYISVWKYNK